MSIITKNLGLIQAIHVAVSAPTATTMLWFDISTTPAVHKFYNTATSQWESIVKDSDNRPPVKLAFDESGTSLPLTDSTQIDSVTVLDGDRVLVIDSATAGEVDRIYLASITAGNITWSVEQDGTGLDDPTEGDFLFILEGIIYENSQAFFTGVTWITGQPHVQNTDTGTTQTSFDIESGGIGVKLKNVGGELQLRDLGDLAYGDLRVGNLTVEGTQTIVNSEIVEIADNIIILNSNVTSGAPSEDGGIHIRRGDEDNASILWNETSDRWTAGVDGIENPILLADLPNVLSATTSLDYGNYALGMTSSEFKLERNDTNDIVGVGVDATSAFLRADDGTDIADITANIVDGIILSDSILNIGARYDLEYTSSDRKWLTHKGYVDDLVSGASPFEYDGVQSVRVKGYQGVGTVDMVNGSGAISGNGTNFLDGAPYTGVAWWGQIWVHDSVQWHRIIINPTAATNASIYDSYNESKIKSGYLTTSATFEGITGTYDFYVTQQIADDGGAFSIGNNGWAEDLGTALGSGVATGNMALATGQETLAEGIQGSSFNKWTRAEGDFSFAGGLGQSISTKQIIANGKTSFNFSENTIAQTAGYGALADNSAILGGIDHHIPSDSPRSVIIGGSGIIAEAALADMVYVPNLRTDGQIQFGDTNDYIYKISEDTLGFVTGGSLKAQVTQGGFLRAGNNNGWALKNVASTTTVPTVIPHYQYTATGIGGIGEIDLITNSLSRLNISDTLITANKPIRISTLGDALEFGDGNTYFIAPTDTTFSLFVDAISTTVWNSSGMFNTLSNGILRAGIVAESPTTINPVFIINHDEFDTGIGGASDTISIITQGSSRLLIENTLSTFSTVVSGVEPTIDAHLATKEYVDRIASQDSKDSAELATTANITLSGEQTIDGILTSTSRILVKNQGAAAENGIYVTASGAWSRSDDADDDNEVTSGMRIWVDSGGTANGNTEWTLTTANPIIVGTTGLTFTKTGEAGYIDARSGVTKVGNFIELGGTLLGATDINTNVYKLSFLGTGGLDVNSNPITSTTGSVLINDNISLNNEVQITGVSGVFNIRNIGDTLFAPIHVSKVQIRDISSSFSTTLSSTATANRAISLPDIAGTVMLNLVEDITPQLGGNLDLQSFNVIGSGVANTTSGFSLGSDTLWLNHATNTGMEIDFGATSPSVRRKDDAAGILFETGGVYRFLGNPTLRPDTGASSVMTISGNRQTTTGGVIKLTNYASVPFQGGLGISQYMLNLDTTLNQSSDASFNLIEANVNETTVGSGERNLISLSVGGANRFKQSTDGYINISVPQTATLSDDEFLVRTSTGEIKQRNISDIAGDHALGSHSDTDFTGLLDNDLMYRSGGEWVDTAGGLTYNGATFSNLNGDIIAKNGGTGFKWSNLTSGLVSGFGYINIKGSPVAISDSFNELKTGAAIGSIYALYFSTGSVKHLGIGIDGSDNPIIDTNTGKSLSIKTANVEAINIASDAYVKMPLGLGINGATATSTIPLHVDIATDGIENINLGNLVIKNNAGVVDVSWGVSSSSLDIIHYSYSHATTPNKTTINPKTPNFAQDPGDFTIIGAGSWTGTNISNKGGDIVLYAGSGTDGTDDLQDGTGGDVIIDGGVNANAGTEGNVLLSTKRGLTIIGDTTNQDATSILQVSPQQDASIILGYAKIWDGGFSQAAFGYHNLASNSVAVSQSSGGDTYLQTGASKILYIRQAGATQWTMGTTGNLVGSAGNDFEVNGTIGINTTPIATSLLTASASDTSTHTDTAWVVADHSAKITIANTGHADNSGSYLYFESENTGGSVAQSYIGSLSNGASNYSTIVFGVEVASSINQILSLNGSGGGNFINSTANFQPTTDDTWNLGVATSQRWKDIFFNPTTSGSASDNILTLGTDGGIEYRTAASLGAEHELGDHTDVDTAGLATGSMLYYDSANWVDSGSTMTWSGTQLTLPGGSAANPSLLFNANETGIFGTASYLSFSIAGASAYLFATNYITAGVDGFGQVGYHTNRFDTIYSEYYRTGRVAGNAFSLSAWDVDGSSQVDFITITANNTPTLVIASPTGGTTSITADSLTMLGDLDLSAEDRTSQGITESPYLLWSATTEEADTTDHRIDWRTNVVPTNENSSTSEFKLQYQLDGGGYVDKFTIEEDGDVVLAQSSPRISQLGAGSGTGLLFTSSQLYRSFNTQTFRSEGSVLQYQIDATNHKFYEDDGTTVILDMDRATGVMTGDGSGFTNLTSANLDNDTITIGTTAIALGGTATTISGLTNIISTTHTATTALARVKYGVFNNTTYGMGFDGAYTYGGLTSHAITFQTDTTSGRGFWWGDTGHATNAVGIMALTNLGELTVAHSMRLGYGESDTTTPGVTYVLDVSGDTLIDGDILAGNSNGPKVRNTTSANVTPTLIPNRASGTTGIGGATHSLSQVQQGTLAALLTATNYTFYEDDGSTAILDMDRTDGSISFNGSLSSNGVIAESSSFTLTSGVTINNTKQITYASNTTVKVGDLITGTGIKANTYIREITSATTADMSRNASAAGSGLTFTIYPENVGSYIANSFTGTNSPAYGMVIENDFSANSLNGHGVEIRSIFSADSDRFATSLSLMSNTDSQIKFSNEKASANQKTYHMGIEGATSGEFTIYRDDDDGAGGTTELLRLPRTGSIVQVNSYLSSLSGNQLYLFGNTDTTGVPSVVARMSGNTLVQTSGEHIVFSPSYGNGGATFAPTTGTAEMSWIEINPTINQNSGTATGITRGLKIDPTLTDATDWRAIDVMESGVSQFRVGEGGDVIVNTGTSGGTGGYYFGSTANGFQTHASFSNIVHLYLNSTLWALFDPSNQVFQWGSSSGTGGTRIRNGGAVATPHYSFIGDVNTGMYKIGSGDTNELGFATDGTLALTIDATQDASFTATVKAQGLIQARAVFEFGTDSTDGVLRNISTAGDIDITAGTTSGELRFNASGALALTIDSVQTTTINGKGFIVPVGLVGDQVDTKGSIRYSTTEDDFEGYNGTVWAALGGGGTSYTFENGLTESGGTVKLGGALTGATEITTTATNVFTITTNSASGLDGFNLNHSSATGNIGFEFRQAGTQAGYLQYEDSNNRLVLASTVASSKFAINVNATTELEINDAGQWTFGTLPATVADVNTNTLLSVDASGNIEKLSASGDASTDYLSADGTWSTPAGSGGTIGGDATATYISYGDGSNSITGEAGFEYNDTTNTLLVDNIEINNVGAGTNPIFSSNAAGLQLDLNSALAVTGTLKAAAINITSAIGSPTFSTTQILTRDSTGVVRGLTAAGASTGRFLQDDGAWATPSGTIGGDATANEISYGSGSNTITSDEDFTWLAGSLSMNSIVASQASRILMNSAHATSGDTYIRFSNGDTTKDWAFGLDSSTGTMRLTEAAAGGANPSSTTVIQYGTSVTWYLNSATTIIQGDLELNSTAIGAADINDSFLMYDISTERVEQLNPSGTPSATTYLRGDGSWATPAGGGIGGSIAASNRIAFGNGTLDEITDSAVFYYSKVSTSNNLYLYTNTSAEIARFNIWATGINTASEALVNLVTYTSGGDAYIRYSQSGSGAKSWATGYDTNDSLKYKISYASNTTATPSSTAYLSITTAGNVGIGSTSPNALLSVGGNGVAGVFSVEGTGSGNIMRVTEDSGENIFDITGEFASTYAISIGDYDGVVDGAYLQIDEAHIGLGIGGDEVFIINDGNYAEVTSRLGIGTTGPSYKLDLESSDASWAARILNTQTTGGAGLLVRSDSTTNTAILGVYGNGGYKLYVEGDGNVGIGTTTPNYQFTVHDSASLHAYASFTNSTTGQTGSDGLTIGINSSEEALIWNRENTLMKFGTNATQRMTIQSGGNVSIGNTNNTYLLDVNTTAIIRTSLRIGGTTLTGGYSLELSGSNNKGRANDWTATSDIHLKTNINSYGSVLDGLDTLKNSKHGLSLYNRWVLDENGNPTSKYDTNVELGLIAQEMKEVFPYLVNGSDDEYLDISYMKLAAIAAIGVAELREETKSEVDILKERVLELENKVEQLEK